MVETKYTDEEAKRIVRSLKRSNPKAFIDDKRVTSVHIWSRQQVAALNYLRKIGKEDFMPDRIYDAQTSDETKYITIPVTMDEERQAKVNWIEHLGEGFFWAGVTYIGDNYKDPFDGMSGIWCLIIEEGKGFVPLFDISQIDAQDFIDKGKRILKEKEEERDASIIRGSDSSETERG